MSQLLFAASTYIQIALAIGAICYAIYLVYLRWTRTSAGETFKDVIAPIVLAAVLFATAAYTARFAFG